MEKMKMYRNSTIGSCSLAPLEELVNENSMTKELTLKVLYQFDKSMLEAFQILEEALHKLSITGKLQQYKFIDSCWTFDLQNAIVSAEKREIWLKVEGNMRIMAFNGKLVKQ